MAMALSLSAIVSVSCNNVKMPFVKRGVLEASEEENSALRSSLKETRENYEKQAQELNEILAEITSISGRTTKLQISNGNEGEQLSQAELISEEIDALKERLDKLEAEASRAKRQRKELAVATSTIKELRETVYMQEQQISSLKKAILEKDTTIRIQKDTISNQSSKISKQYSTILKQKEDLAAKVEEMTEQLYQAGLDFEGIADNGDFTISGKRNKTNVKDYRKSIYFMAATYFEKASELGHKDASAHLEAVQTKMAGIK